MQLILLFLTILVLVECKTTRKIYPFTYTDCAPRSRISIKIKPNPPNFLKPLHVQLSGFAAYSFNSLTYNVDIWGGTGPDKTTRIYKFIGSPCVIKGFSCKGKVGEKFVYSRVRLLDALPRKLTFYNATATIVNENREMELCVKMEGSVV
uniref:Uncharacterized LOC100180576 n=1 Tax=Ciona intestinalis TaxID=7719 RepID=H2Y1X3_CIOIN|nr:uncharacterized protein LOC100180576 [Ciona intestinalis]|eukprot:XP_002128811.1 uncharacterized protein LOC100180576 [Ciona intestinalis]